MDHLQTSEERKDRWYAKHLTPIYVRTEPAETWDDLWDETSYVKNYNVSNNNIVNKTLPFEWIRENCDQSSSSDGDHISSLSRQRIQKALDCHGFLVVSGVLSQQDCHHSLQEAWDWIEAASEAERFVSGNHTEKETTSDATKVQPKSHVCRHDMSTLESSYFPRSVEGGMLPFYGSGHSQFAWTIRSHTNVKRVFEVIHGTSNLISSLDGIVLWRGGHKVRKLVFRVLFDTNIQQELKHSPSIAPFLFLS